MARLNDCIRMLQVLKVHGMMSRSELAAALGCSIRQVLDYKRELEEAGYEIESIRGMHGGYVLKTKSILPSTSFTAQEMHALQEARAYMDSHKDFLLQKDYLSAMDKLLASLSYEHSDNGIYMTSEASGLSRAMKEAIQLCEWARDHQYHLEIQYRSMRADTYELIRIQPYELLHYKEGYYCLAYSLKAKDYRIYKFSEERMKSCRICEQTFLRDQDFQLLKYVGKSGLIHGETYELELIVYGKSARFLAEKNIGINAQKKWLGKDCLHVNVMMEGKLEALQFLMGLQNECKLIAPLELKKEMQKIIEDMNKAYSS